ncbi:unnamed protein product, partial [Sphacelaria rigidula]
EGGKKRRAPQTLSAGGDGLDGGGSRKRPSLSRAVAATASSFADGKSKKRLPPATAAHVGQGQGYVGGGGGGGAGGAGGSQRLPWRRRAPTRGREVDRQPMIGQP